MTILDLSHHVGCSVDWLEDAIEVASELASDEQGNSLGWVEMEETISCMYDALKQLQDVLLPVRNSILAARQHQEEMEDMWDATRFGGI